MEVSYIVVAYDFSTPRCPCLGIVAAAFSLHQANTIVKAFASVALSCQSPIMYVVRDLASASLYGPECAVDLVQHWRPTMVNTACSVSDSHATE